MKLLQVAYERNTVIKKRLPLRVLGLLVLTATLGACSTSPEDAPTLSTTAENGVTLFIDCPLSGTSVGLSEGNYNVNNLAALGMPNDKVSSLRVAPGFKVEIFLEKDFSGRSLSFTRDDSCLTDNNFNDLLSSVRVTRTGNTSGGCNARTWTRGVNYKLGDVVKFPANGNYYKVVNVGPNGSDGTDPTISTWYWQPTKCTGGGGNPPPPPPPPGNGNFVVSEAQYNQMFPNRIPYYNYSGLVAALSAWPTFANAGSDTVKRQEAAAFLANMHHESGGGVYVREINQANWPLYCSKGVGNCGGKQYYGRGPTQLSWDYNYQAAGNALGIDLINNPDLVADNSTVGWKTALWYWMTQRAQAARTPHDAVVQGAGFGETIRAINGGLECNGAGEAQRTTRINLYRTFTGILGVPPGDNLGC